MISRRLLLQRGATATALAGIAVATVQCQPTEAPAAQPDISVAFRIEASLIAYRTAMREERALSKRYSVVHEALPAWAKPGPSHLLPDGSKGGPNSEWPEVVEMPPLPADSFNRAVIRQGPREYWNNRKSALVEYRKVARHDDGTITIPPSVPLVGEARRQARLETIAGMRKLLARKRQQDAEYAKAGLYDLEAAMDERYQRRQTIQTDIESYATGCSPAEIGVLTMFEHRFGSEDFTRSILERIAPHVDGTLREAVDSVLNDGEWA